MNTQIHTLLDSLAATTASPPWQKIAVALAALFIVYKLISFQIGMIIKLVITVAIIAAVAYFIFGVKL